MKDFEITEEGRAFIRALRKKNDKHMKEIEEKNEKVRTQVEQIMLDQWKPSSDVQT